MLGRPQGVPYGDSDLGWVLRGRFCQMPRVPVVGTHASPLHFAYNLLPHFPSLQARDVYEEAIRTVMTVRDFTQVFDSYAQFEESMIAAKMETASELGREEEGELGERGP